MCAELGRFWEVYAKEVDGRVSKAEYLKVHSKFTLVLIPGTQTARCPARHPNAAISTQTLTPPPIYCNIRHGQVIIACYLSFYRMVFARRGDPLLTSKIFSTAAPAGVHQRPRYFVVKPLRWLTPTSPSSFNLFYL